MRSIFFLEITEKRGFEMIKLHILATEGHKEAVFDDTLPEERAALAKRVGDLMGEGYTCFLRCSDGKDRLIVGYDMISNGWITRAAARKGTEVVPVKEAATATAVPRIVGG